MVLACDGWVRLRASCGHEPPGCWFVSWWSVKSLASPNSILDSEKVSEQAKKCQKLPPAQSECDHDEPAYVPVSNLSIAHNLYERLTSAEHRAGVSSPDYTTAVQRYKRTAIAGVRASASELELFLATRRRVCVSCIFLTYPRLSPQIHSAAIAEKKQKAIAMIALLD